MKHLLAVGAVCAALMPYIALAQDGAPSSGDAAAHFKRGVELFNENKKEAAVQEFNIAYKIKPAWKILYNIGQCHASLKRYGMAIEAFEKYLGKGGDEVPQDRQDEVLGELDRLRKMVGRVKVQGSEGVDIYIDEHLRGRTPMVTGIQVTAGVEHRIRLVRDGVEIFAVNETVSGAEVLELTAPEPVSDAPPEPTPGVDPTDPVETGSENGAGGAGAQPAVEDDNSGTGPVVETPAAATRGRSGLPKAVFIATAAAGGVFGLATGAFAIAVNAKWNNSEENIKNDPSVVNASAVADNIHTLQVLGYVSMGLAAASLITAAVVIPFTDWDGNKSDGAALKAAPWMDGESGGLMLEGRF